MSKVPQDLLIFKDHAQALVWEHCLMGQISDGAWGNSPSNNWKRWSDRKVAVSDNQLSGVAFTGDAVWEGKRSGFRFYKKLVSEMAPDIELAREIDAFRLAAINGFSYVDNEDGKNSNYHAKIKIIEHIGRNKKLGVPIYVEAGAETERKSNYYGKLKEEIEREIVKDPFYTNLLHDIEERWADVYSINKSNSQLAVFLKSINDVLVRDISPKDSEKVWEKWSKSISISKSEPENIVRQKKKALVYTVDL